MTELTLALRPRTGRELSSVSRRLSVGGPDWRPVHNDHFGTAQSARPEIAPAAQNAAQRAFSESHS
jgi:hypothetical protein